MESAQCHKPVDLGYLNSLAISAAIGYALAWISPVLCVRGAFAQQTGIILAIYDLALILRRNMPNIRQQTLTFKLCFQGSYLGELGIRWFQEVAKKTEDIYSRNRGFFSDLKVAYQLI